MYKIIIFFINIIPVKKWRKMLREYFNNEIYRKNINKTLVYLFKNDTKFYQYTIKDKSILIVEPNPYHAEILPGFVKYFKDLGYNVDLFIRHENIEEKIFVGHSKTFIQNIFVGSAQHLKKLLKLEKIKNYEYVFFSSSAYWEPYGYTDSYLNYLGFEPKCKNGLLLVEHNIDPCLKKYNEEKYVEQGRLFTLSGFENTNMLSPHCYGYEKVAPKNKVTKFIVVGGINIESKNHNLLFQAVRNLKNNGENEFKVIIVGGGNKLDIPKDILQNVEHKGRLNFKKMFMEVNNADFFLPLLDLSIEKHKRYLNSATTGSRQLILGFLKPCLINKEFGNVYGFNEQNSIIYNENDLYSAMLRAILLTKEDYEQKQKNLKLISELFYNKSLINLKSSIERIENEAC